MNSCSFCPSPIRRIVDPQCQAAENECKSKRKKTADLVKEIDAKKEAEKQKLDALTDKLKKVMEEFPPKCDEGTPAPAPGTPAESPTPAAG